MTTSGINRSDFDPSIRVQDDLFRHVNGHWLATTDIPADRARFGSFIALRDRAEEAVRAIAEQASAAAGAGTEDPVEQKIGDLYASFLDEERVETLGAEPIRADLERAAAPATVDEFVALLGELERTSVAGAFATFVDTDKAAPDQYVVYLYQGGIGLPDEAYYREEAHEAERVAYVKHVERMLALAGLDDPAGRAARIFTLETDIAAVHWDRVACRDATKTYNPTTLAELKTLLPAWDWELWLDRLGAPAGILDHAVVYQPSFFEGLGALLTPERLPAWRDWLAWHVVHSAAPFLSRAFVEENFDFYGRTLSGTEELRARWKRAVGFLEGTVGEAVGQLYVAKHFPPEHKARMQQLVADLVEAYRESITGLEWMGEATRAKALEKLEAFTPKIGYPDKWRDYSALAVVPGDLLGNARRAAEFEMRRELAKIGGPVDRGEWFMTPQTVNAYYNPGMNEIVFPAAILQPPFFDADADDAANYGGIGAVIGHEIGHGFDDQGSKYDGAGALADWWTAEDRAAFEERTKKLIAQYDALEPPETPGKHVNGALTIGENIGDLGGFTIAWKAYRIALRRAGLDTPPVVDGMSGAERFLFSWATTWQSKSRPAALAQQIATDPHSPEEFRCNQVVRNAEIFYETFHVEPGDAMWLDPADRVSIW